MKNGREFVVLTEKEEELIESIKAVLISLNDKEEVAKITTNVNALKELAGTISLYPSILRNQNLGKASRSVETLVNNLCLREESDLIFNIPTKAILGQGFSVAKINFFYMLFYLTFGIDRLGYLIEDIFDVIKKNIFSIMAEDVFLSIISDKNIDIDTRNIAAYLLANIWEYRIYQGVREFAPVLSNIWRARGKISPSYGTMLGVTELFMMSDSLDQVWMKFLQRENLESDEIHSLQEFLMGLSYEELCVLSEAMEKNRQCAISREGIEGILGKKTVYSEYRADDPREFYRFYNQRKNNASHRTKASLPGPKKTIEEYMMRFLLSRPEEWGNY